MKRIAFIFGLLCASTLSFNRFVTAMDEFDPQTFAHEQCEQMKQNPITAQKKLRAAAALLGLGVEFENLVNVATNENSSNQQLLQAIETFESSLKTSCEAPHGLKAVASCPNVAIPTDSECRL